MAPAAPISQQDVARFRDNLLRVQIMCNSLRAFAADEGAAAGLAAEARTFRRFLADELPVVMQQNENILNEAIRARGDSEAAVQNALNLLHEDHERLDGLVARVCERLRAAARCQDGSAREALRREISAFLAAQRNYMAWSRKIVDQAAAGGGSPA